MTVDEVDHVDGWKGSNLLLFLLLLGIATLMDRVSLMIKRR